MARTGVMLTWFNFHQSRQRPPVENRNKAFSLFHGQVMEACNSIKICPMQSDCSLGTSGLFHYLNIKVFYKYMPKS